MTYGGMNTNLTGTGGHHPSRAFPEKHCNRASLCQMLQELPNLLVSQHSQHTENVNFSQDLPQREECRRLVQQKKSGIGRLVD